MNALDFILSFKSDAKPAVQDIEAVTQKLKGLEKQAGVTGKEVAQSMAPKAGAPGGGGWISRAVDGFGAMKGQAIAAAGAVRALAGVGAALAVLKFGKDAVDDLKRLERQTGLNVDALQKLQYAAGNDEKFHSWLEVIGEIRKSQSELVQGNQEMTKAYAGLGFSVKEVEQLGPDEIFLKIARSARQGGINVGNFADALKVMGRQGKDVLPGLKADVSAAIAEFEKLNLKINSGTIEALSGFSKGAKTTWHMLVEGAKKASAEIAGVAVGLGKVVVGLGAGMFAGGIDNNTTTGGALRDQMFTEVASQMMGGEGDTSEAQAKLDQRKSARKERDEQRKKALDDARLKNQAKAEEIASDGMSAEEKINYLLQQRLELMKKISAEKDPLKKELLSGDQLDVEKKLQTLQSDDKSKDRKATQTPSDALQSIGLFVGVGTASQIPQQQLAVLKNVEMKLVNIEGQLRSFGS